MDSLSVEQTQNVSAKPKLVLKRRVPLTSHLLTSQPIRIEKQHFRLDFYAAIFSPDECQQFYHILETTTQWPRAFTPGRRCNQTYGDAGLVYEIVFGGYGGQPRQLVQRTAIDWSQLPLLIHIRDVVSKTVGQDFNFCVVQRYPSGRVGINPHRDKEMASTSLICGLSLGCERRLTMGPPRHSSDTPVQLNLHVGSLYVLRPPTNDYWTHCIEKDESTQPRISLTFRNVPTPAVKT